MVPKVAEAAADLAHYALAVSPDGSALYAVNPVLGRVVGVRGGLPYGARERATNLCGT